MIHVHDFSSTPARATSPQPLTMRSATNGSGIGPFSIQRIKRGRAHQSAQKTDARNRQSNDVDVNMRNNQIFGTPYHMILRGRKAC